MNKTEKEVRRETNLPFEEFADISPRPDIDECAFKGMVGKRCEEN
jgi:hypothetical protein